VVVGIIAYYLFVSILVVFLGILLHMRFVRIPDKKDFYGKGVKAYSTQNYKKAIEFFTKAIAENEDSYELYYNLGLAYASMKDFENAKFNFTKANSMSPDDADINYNLALLLYNNAQYEGAKEFFQKSIELNNNDPDSYYNVALTEIMITSPDYKVAIENINRAIVMKPENIEYFLALAQIYDKKSDSSGMIADIDEAISAYEKVLSINNNLEEPNYRLAVCYAKKGLWEESVYSCKEVIKINPKSAVAHNQLGLALYCKGDIDEAILMYQKAIELDKNFDIAYKNLGYAYEKQGNFRDSVNMFTKYASIVNDPMEIDSINSHIKELTESITIKS
jgi:tetratricopeptide (TPR) repeat protein